MKQIEIYTKPTCGYCRMAKRLLQEKGASYTEIDLASNPEKRNEMIQRARGSSTVPQIFIEGDHIGGCDDLYNLERSGKLDGKLAV